MSDIILLAPNGTFTEKDMKLDEQGEKELDDLKKRLNLPKGVENVRA